MKLSLPISLVVFFAAVVPGIAAEAPAGASAESGGTADPVDVLFLKNGLRRTGKIVGVDSEVFRVRVQIRDDQPAATIGIPIEEVERLEFAEDEERIQFIAGLVARPGSPEIDEINRAAGYWGEGQRFLPFRRSRAARIGVLYADLLLRSENPRHRERALEIFTQVETEAWSPDDQALGRQGRLRAMLRTGRAADAVEEARALADASEDPAVLIEAKFILATAADAELRRLEQEHPRWEEDVFVRPERARLYHEALDLYLFPALFYGSEVESAARGLWGAAQVYQFGGDASSAVEAARDILVLYPESTDAARARDFLASLPEAITRQDHEKEAKELLE